MHLSHVPADQTFFTYDGSGEWLKIHSTGIEIRKELEDPGYWLPLNGARVRRFNPQTCSTSL